MPHPYSNKSCYREVLNISGCHSNFFSQAVVRIQTNQHIFYSFFNYMTNVTFPHDCIKVNQKLFFKGTEVGRVTLPHESRLIFFNAQDIFIFFQIYISTILITNFLCLLIFNKKKTNLYKLLQMKISFFSKILKLCPCGCI